MTTQIRVPLEFPAPLKTKTDKPLLQPELDELWVRNDDDVHELAYDLIEKLIGESRPVNLACIGAACLNQAIKAIAVARDHMTENHHFDLVMQPYFSTFIDDQSRSRTRMMLRVTTVSLT